MRRFFLWVHLTAGLAMALYAIAIGISGSILVFREELNEIVYPEFHRGDVPVQLISPDAALAAVRGANAGWTAYSLTWPNADSAHYMAYLSRGGDSQEVFAKADTGEVLGARGTRAGWLGRIAQLHFNLLLGGKTGHVVQECGVIALGVLAGTGLWLVWPPRLRVRRLIFWRDLHYATGSAAVVFIAMWALTGGYYIWLQPYLAFVDLFFARTATPLISDRVREAAILPLADLAARAQAEFPDLPLYRMGIPNAPDQTVQVTLLEATPTEFHRVSTVALDPVTGEVLQKISSADRATGNTLLSWISVIHFGRFGGIAIKILWSLMGLSLPVLSVSGCILWWRRIVRPRLRRMNVVAMSSR